MTHFRLLLTVAIAAYACQLAVQHATPIDHALPFVAIVVTLVSALSYPSLMLSVPLLIAAEIAIPDEGLRLLAFGAVVAGVFAVALSESAVGSRQSAVEPLPDESVRTSVAWVVGPLPTAGRRLPTALALLAILLLRWIPFSGVHLGRELFLLAIAALIVLVLDRTPFAIAVAVIVVLITPAIPLRTLLLPIAVLFVAILAKVLGMPRLVLRWPSTIAVALAMLFFAWSGVVARAFPYFLQRARPVVPRHVVAQALPANETLTLEVPQGATSLVVSGANVARMPRGTPLGRVEPGGRIVRIGDAADWGSLRREHFYGNRNPLPRDPAGRLREYGYSAWLDGAGRVPIPRGARTIRVTANAALPPGASLQIEGFE